MPQCRVSSRSSGSIFARSEVDEPTLTMRDGAPARSAPLQGIRQNERREMVHRQHGIVTFRRHLPPRGEHAGVIDEHAKPRMCRSDLQTPTMRFTQRAKIGQKHFCAALWHVRSDPGSDSVAAFPVPANQDNMIIGACQPQCNPSPDPARSTGDNTYRPTCLTQSLHSSAPYRPLL